MDDTDHGAHDEEVMVKSTGVAPIFTRHFEAHYPVEHQTITGPPHESTQPSVPG